MFLFLSIVLFLSESKWLVASDLLHKGSTVLLNSSRGNVNLTIPVQTFKNVITKMTLTTSKFKVQEINQSVTNCSINDNQSVLPNSVNPNCLNTYQKKETVISPHLIENSINCSCKLGKDFCNVSGGCQPCTVCRALHPHAITYAACNQTQDTICKCIPGFYFDKVKQSCISCTKCQPGEAAVQKCALSQNTKCAPCTYEMFSRSATTKLLCQKCRAPCNITASEVQVSVCSSTSNRVCCHSSNLKCTEWKQEQKFIEDAALFRDVQPIIVSELNGLGTNDDQWNSDNTEQQSLRSNYSSDDLMPFYCSLMGVIILALVIFVIYKHYQLKLCTAIRGQQSLLFTSSKSKNTLPNKFNLANIPLNFQQGSPVYFPNHTAPLSINNVPCNLQYAVNYATDRYNSDHNNFQSLPNKMISYFQLEQHSIDKPEDIKTCVQPINSLTRKRLKQLGQLLELDSDSVIGESLHCDIKDGMCQNPLWISVAYEFGYDQNKCNKFQEQISTTKTKESAAYLFLKDLANIVIKPNENEMTSSQDFGSYQRPIHNFESIDNNVLINNSCSPKLVTVKMLSNALLKLGLVNANDLLLKPMHHNNYNNLNYFIDYNRMMPINTNCKLVRIPMGQV